MQKHSKITPWILLTLATGLSVGCNNTEQNGQQTQQAAVGGQQAPKPVVGVITATYQAVPQTQSLSGRTVAYQEAEVRPQISGIIQKRLFVEGSYVTKGQPLYQIDTDNYTNMVNVQKATLAQAKANLNLLEVKLKRYQSLLASNAVSQQDYDDIKAQTDVARAALASAKAQLSANQLNLDRTLVRAPISGKVNLSNVDVGTLVTANQATALTKISQLDPIYVDISQSSTEMLKLQQLLSSGSLEDNQKKATVALTLEDGNQYATTGHLSFSEAQVNPDTGSVTLRAVFDNDQRLLLPGMYVTATIQQGFLKNAILIPQSAVMRTADGKTQVYMIDSNNTIQPLPITTAGTYQSQWIVTDGIPEGTHIVVTGGMKVKPSTPVDPQPAETLTKADNTNAKSTPPTQPTATADTQQADQ